MGRFMQVGGITLTGLATTALLVRKYQHKEYKQQTLSEPLTHVDRNNSDDKLELKCVQIFFRHGARTPLKHVPGVEEV